MALSGKPHTPIPGECGALAGDLSDFRLPVLPRFAGFLTVLDASVIDRGSLARLIQKFAFDAIFNRHGIGTEAYKPCFWWLNWNIGHFTVINGNKAGFDLVLMQRTLPAFLCKSCCSYTNYLVFFKHNFHKKTKEVCPKPRSTSASHSLKGEAFKCTTVKWSVGYVNI